MESVLSSPLSQHALCKKLDDHLFQSILITSSPANKARLLSASAPHASSWLSVVPSLGLLDKCVCTASSAGHTVERHRSPVKVVGGYLSMLAAEFHSLHGGSMSTSSKAISSS